MLVSIVVICVVGLIAGFVARALVPGNDHMGLLGTMVLGIVGSVVGYFLFDVLLGNGSDNAVGFAGIIGSIVGAILALLVYRLATRGSISRV